MTVTDPNVYTAPWTVALPLNRDPSYLMFEYSCHEGNLALPNALRAGRAREQAARGQLTQSVKSRARSRRTPV